MLTMESKEQNNAVIFYLSGELVFNDTEEAEKEFMKKLAGKPRVIALDCKNLKSLDSSGLGLFIKFSKEAQKAGVDLVFINIGGNISTLFDVSKLDKMFEIITEDEFKAAYL